MQPSIEIETREYSNLRSLSFPFLETEGEDIIPIS